MRIRVNLDVDGVIGAFDDHCEDRFGRAPHKGLTHTCDLTGQVTKGDTALWKHVASDPGFWLDMPLLPGAHELVELCQPYGVRFLTGCPKSDYDRADREKKVKLGKTFPGIPVITCLSRDKALHMQEAGDVLVDDFFKNTKRWEEAGGRAVRYRSFEQSFEEVRMALIEQFGVM